MPNATWSNCKREFAPDGSLRDIYVLETSIADWERLLGALRSQYQLQFESGKLDKLPPTALEVFAVAPEQGALLSINVNGIKVNCHFFWDRVIELDLNPSEICDELAFESLLEFMRHVGNAVEKPVRLTPENQQEHRLLEYNPMTGDVVYFP